MFQETPNNRVISQDDSALSPMDRLRALAQELAAANNAMKSDNELSLTRPDELNSTDQIYKKICIEMGRVLDYFTHETKIPNFHAHLEAMKNGTSDSLEYLPVDFEIQLFEDILKIRNQQLSKVESWLADHWWWTGNFQDYALARLKAKIKEHFTKKIKETTDQDQKEKFEEVIRRIGTSIDKSIVLDSYSKYIAKKNQDK